MRLSIIFLASILPVFSYAEWVIQAVPLAPTALSADGSTIAGGSWSWNTVTGLHNLGDLPGGATLTEVLGISSNGAVIVGRSSSAASGASRMEAFRWTESTGIVGLGDLAGGPVESAANATSDDGTIIVGRGTGSSTTQATRWTLATGMQPLSSTTSDAYDVTADGAVIVGYKYNPSFYRRAFRWENGALQELGSLGISDDTFAHLVSDDGQTVLGVSADGPEEMFGWTSSGGITSLGSMPYGGNRITGFKVGFDLISMSSRYPSSSGYVRDLGLIGWRHIKGWLEGQPHVGLDGWVMSGCFISSDGLTLTGSGVGPGGRGSGWFARWNPADRRDVTGTIDFQDLEAGAARPPTIDCWFVPEQSGEELGAQSSLLPGDQFHLVAPSPPGRYWLYVKPSHWLSKRVLIDTTLGGVSGISLSVKNGDCDGDNDINIGDYSLLSAAFGAFPEDARWNPDTDLNGDEAVDIGDFAILSANFGEAGD